jgi:predicted transcriptional regulator
MLETIFMSEYRFRLAISAQEYLAYYEGAARAVVVTLGSGQRLQFPAEFLRRFVSREGVHGTFVLRVDVNNKLQAIERVGD